MPNNVTHQSFSFHFSNSKPLKSLGLVVAAAAAPWSSSSSIEATGIYGLMLLGHTTGSNLQTLRTQTSLIKVGILFEHF
jgi:hypothetical protein